MIGDRREVSTLVGRSRELELIGDLIADAAGGSSALLRVSGPAGVGKSRLCREALRLARDAGFTTALARPAEHGEDGPFGAAVGALGPLLRARTAAARGRLVGDLAPLGWLFAGWGLPAAEPLTDVALQRLVLLEALGRLVQRISRDGPLLWVVDGFDRIDSGSADLLNRLAAILADRPVLVMVAGAGAGPVAGTLPGSRSPAVALDRACADFGWRRERIGLRALDETDAATLAQQIVGGALSDSLRAALHRRCAGTPLYVVSTAQELLERGQLVDRGGQWSLTGPDIPLPPDLDDQLRETVSRLPPEQRAVLVTLSVAGGPLPLEVLGAVAGHLGDPGTTSPPETLAGLERRRLVAGTGAGYDVVHGLVREVVAAHLSTTERRAAHAALATALRRRDAGDPRIAEHVLRAGPLAGPDLAPVELIRGGRRARTLGATEDAYRYLLAALAAYPRDGAAAAAADLPPAAAVLAEAAELAEALGNGTAARDHWDQILARSDPPAPAVETARALRHLAMLDWSVGRSADAERRLQAAEVALAGLEPGTELGEVYYARTVAAQRRADAAAVDREAGRLREVARSIGSPALRARADLAAAAFAYASTDYAAAGRLNDHALRAARLAGDLRLEVRAHDQISVVAAAEGCVRTMAEHSRASIEVAGRANLPMLGLWPRGRLLVADLMSGNLDAALRVSADLVVAAERTAPPRGAASCFALHALVLTHRGRLRAAHAVLQRSRHSLGDALARDRNVATIVEYSAGTLALAEGDPEAARLACSRLGELSGGWAPLLGAALLGEAHARAGAVEEARRVAGRIQGLRSCSTGLPAALAHWIGALTAPSTAEAAEHCVAAAAGFDGLGLRLQAHRSLLRQAETGGPTRDAAIDAAQRACEFFDRMGAPAPARAARQLLRRWGVAPPPPSRAGTAPPLSDRESEVARLVARGLSNAAVATELFISPRTVTTHLEHIYGKLGVSSRVALTRYLTDADLLA